VFESGAILVYLADKTGQFLPQDLRGRTAALEWLMWQVGGLGPMAGQNHHFVQYAPEKLPYAINRYVNETNRLYGVLDRQLSKHTYVSGEEYSIADMAIYPWVVPWEKQQQKLSDTPHVQRWLEQVGARPATQRAYARAQEYVSTASMTADAKQILFGQTAASVQQASDTATQTKR
jgi:GST-like protein